MCDKVVCDKVVCDKVVCDKIICDKVVCAKVVDKVVCDNLYVIQERTRRKTRRRRTTTPHTHTQFCREKRKTQELDSLSQAPDGLLYCFQSRLDPPAHETQSNPRRKH